jgi:hypothetical protein
MAGVVVVVVPAVVWNISEEDIDKSAAVNESAASRGL